MGIYTFVKTPSTNLSIGGMDLAPDRGLLFCGEVKSCRDDNQKVNKAYYNKEFGQEYRFNFIRKFSAT